MRKRKYIMTKKRHLSDASKNQDQQQETGSSSRRRRSNRPITITPEARNTQPTDPNIGRVLNLNRLAGEHGIYGTGFSSYGHRLESHEQQLPHQQSQISSSDSQPTISTPTEWQYIANQRPEALAVSRFWSEPQSNQTYLPENQPIYPQTERPQWSDFSVEAWQESANNPETLATNLWDLGSNISPQDSDFQPQETPINDSQQQRRDKGKERMSRSEEDQITTDETHARQIIYEEEQQERQQTKQKQHAQTRVGTSYIQESGQRIDFAKERTTDTNNRKSLDSISDETQKLSETILETIKNGKQVRNKSLDEKRCEEIIIYFKQLKKDKNNTVERNDLIRKAIDVMGNKKRESRRRQKLQGQGIRPIEYRNKLAQQQGFQDFSQQQNQTAQHHKKIPESTPENKQIYETTEDRRNKKAQDEGYKSYYDKLDKKAQDEGYKSYHDKKAQDEGYKSYHDKRNKKAQDEGYKSYYDKKAQDEGYENYHDKRNKKAQDEGYKSYHDKRIKKAQDEGYKSYHDKKEKEEEYERYQDKQDKKTKDEGYKSYYDKLKSLREQAQKQGDENYPDELNKLEGLLHTQEELTNALSEHARAPSQQYDSLLVQHLQQQINTTEAEIQEYFTNDEVIYLLDYFQATY